MNHFLWQKTLNFENISILLFLKEEKMWKVSLSKENNKKLKQYVIM